MATVEMERLGLARIRSLIGESVVREVETVCLSTKDALWLYSLAASAPPEPLGWQRALAAVLMIHHGGRPTVITRGAMEEMNGVALRWETDLDGDTVIEVKERNERIKWLEHYYAEEKGRKRRGRSSEQ